MNEKALAPALLRGIEIIDFLNQCKNPVGLDAISTFLNIPKASLLRLLGVLIEKNIVLKKNNGEYVAIKNLSRIDKENDKIYSLMDFYFKEWSQSHAMTLEWYEPELRGLVLSLRAEGPSNEVTIHANLGFVREWDHELEAVSILGNAFSKLAPPTPSSMFLYADHGIPKNKMLSEIQGIVGESFKTGFHADPFFNKNGIRRMACPVFQDKELFGILAYAEKCQFPLTECSVNSLKTLQGFGKKIENLLK